MSQNNQEELTIDKCSTCGALPVDSGGSLHVWTITFQCGCVICGPIGSDDIEIYKECPKEKKNIK